MKFAFYNEDNYDVLDDVHDIVLSIIENECEPFIWICGEEETKAFVTLYEDELTLALEGEIELSVPQLTQLIADYNLICKLVNKELGKEE